MSTSYKAVKGMPDLLPETMPLWHFLEEKIFSLMKRYAYEEIRTPVLEKTDLFKRSIGEVTDIVEKEMYTFADRDKTETRLSLRPEGTASCVRAVLENNLIRNNQQQRLWYLGPMFRRERPQRGRYRQFWQLGVETFSIPSIDIEVEHIQMMHTLWEEIGISDKVQLEINSLGSTKTRAVYIEEVVKYFETHKDILDEDSKRRLGTNPLRILDSKNKNMEEIIKNAPKLIDFLSESEAKEFESIQSILNALNIDFVVNPNIVRGLDYYEGLVYEWVTSELGSQSAICAGGRYDGLIEQLGAPSGNGVGFAMGLERVIELMSIANVKVPGNKKAYLFAVGDIPEDNLHSMVSKIRQSCYGVEIWVNWLSASMKNQMKKADKYDADWAFIIGEDEVRDGKVSVKYLREDGQQQISAEIDSLSKILELS